MSQADDPAPPAQPVLPAPAAPVRAPRRASPARWALTGAAAVAAIALVAGAGVLFAWSIDETHFARPSAELEQLAARVEGVAGAQVVDTERWVEAPIFAAAQTRLVVEVQRGGLPELLAAACSSAYDEPVMWSLAVRTDRGTQVSLHSESDGRSGAVCPDFGIDAVALVDAIDAVAPGISVQPALWENGRFALVSIDESESSAGFSHLLPLVSGSAALREAAGLAADQVVEIESWSLAASIGPAEHDVYAALLRTLAERHGVQDFWATDAATTIDGVDRVQVVGPAVERTAIERLIRGSGLPIAAHEIVFRDA